MAGWGREEADRDVGVAGKNESYVEGESNRCVTCRLSILQRRYELAALEVELEYLPLLDDVVPPVQMQHT